MSFRYKTFLHYVFFNKISSFSLSQVSFGVGLFFLGIVVSAVIIRTSTSTSSSPSSGGDDDARMKRSPNGLHQKLSPRAETEIDNIANRILQVASSEKHESESDFIPVPINVLMLRSKRRHPPDVDLTSLNDSNTEVKDESSQESKSVQNGFNNTRPPIQETNPGNNHHKQSPKLNDGQQTKGNGLMIDLQIT